MTWRGIASACMLIAVTSCSGQAADAPEPVPQVLVEAQVIDLPRSVADRTGLNLVTLERADAASTPGIVQLHFPAPPAQLGADHTRIERVRNLRLKLMWDRYAQDRGNGELLAAPRVVARDGERGEVTVGPTPISYFAPAGDGLFALQTAQSHVRLSVKPAVLTPDTIQLELGLELAHVGSRSALAAAPGFSVGPPRVGSHALTTTIEVAPDTPMLAAACRYAADTPDASHDVLLLVRAIATGVIAQEQRQLGTTEGVETVSTRGKYVYYHYTCSACGHVQPQLVGSEIPATPERPFESQFTCPKCQHRQTVRIGAKPE